MERSRLPIDRLPTDRLPTDRLPTDAIIRLVTTVFAFGLLDLIALALHYFLITRVSPGESSSFTQLFLSEDAGGDTWAMALTGINLTLVLIKTTVVVRAIRLRHQPLRTLWVPFTFAFFGIAASIANLVGSSVLSVSVGSMGTTELATFPVASMVATTVGRTAVFVARVGVTIGLIIAALRSERPELSPKSF
ncbi:MAG: hypothetical protein AAGE52_38410 [Myxococcota bacterium]